jgi:hypothetical protein
MPVRVNFLRDVLNSLQIFAAVAAATATTTKTAAGAHGADSPAHLETVNLPQIMLAKLRKIHSIYHFQKPIFFYFLRYFAGGWPEVPTHLPFPGKLPEPTLLPATNVAIATVTA